MDTIETILITLLEQIKENGNEQELRDALGSAIERIKSLTSVKITLMFALEIYKAAIESHSTINPDELLRKSGIDIDLN